MIKLIQDKTGYTIAILKGDSHQSKWVKEQGTLETDPTVPARLLPLIKEWDIVIDCGANIGSHTVSYAKKVGINGTVYAFEPFAMSYVALVFNCRDLPQVKVFNSAASNLNGRCFSFLPAEATQGGMVNFGMAKVSNIAGEIPEGFETVRRLTLDSFELERCDFIKADCEGSEPNVIRGAKETLKRCKPILFIEINKSALAHFGFTKDDILNPLAELGYVIDGTPDLAAEQVDVLFFPPK